MPALVFTSTVRFGGVWPGMDSRWITTCGKLPASGRKRYDKANVSLQRCTGNSDR
jgi:hypothetical protein